MRSVCTFVCVLLALTLIASTVSATVVASAQNAGFPGSYDNTQAAYNWLNYPMATTAALTTAGSTTASYPYGTDLVLQGAPSYLSVTGPTPDSNTSSTGTASNNGGYCTLLNDGIGYYFGPNGSYFPAPHSDSQITWGAPNGDGHITGQTQGSWCPRTGCVVTFNLNLSAGTGGSPSGYNITSIVSLTGYESTDRTLQQYNVAVQAVGSSTWTSLYTMSSPLGTMVYGENLVTIQDSGLTGLPIATGVQAVQFTFTAANNGGESNNPYDVYHEIDVVRQPGPRTGHAGIAGRGASGPPLLRLEEAEVAGTKLLGWQLNCHPNNDSLSSWERGKQ